MSSEWSIVGRRGKRSSSRRAVRDPHSIPASSNGHASGEHTEKQTTEERNGAPNGASTSQDSESNGTPSRLQSRRGSARVRTPEEKVRDLIAHIEAAKEEILQSDFWREVRRRMQQSEEDALEVAGDDGCATWDRIQEVVVIGLGSIEASVPSRFQMALTLLLVDGFEHFQGPIRVRDPCFSAIDRQILADLGCKVMETDDEAFQCVTHPTLFYAPHCPSPISHNVLAANWTKEALRKVVLIANSFVGVTDMWYLDPSRRGEGYWDAPVVIPLVDSKNVIDTPIGECNFAVRGAFNDTSIMMFPTFTLEHLQVSKISLRHLRPDL